MAEFDKVAIVGVGLIGGSIGLALRERKLAAKWSAVGRRESGLRTAKKLGAIDRGTTSLAEGVADAEVVVVCTPVDTVAEFALEVAEHCAPRTTITDAGSTKQAIVADRRGRTHRPTRWAVVHRQPSDRRRSSHGRRIRPRRVVRRPQDGRHAHRTLAPARRRSTSCDFGRAWAPTSSR